MNERKEHGNGSPEAATGNGKTGVLGIAEIRAETALELGRARIGTTSLAPVFVVSYANWFK